MSLGFPTAGPAPELIEAGFATEVADAPFLHLGYNFADIAHVLVLREGGIIPPDAAARLLGVLVEVHDIPASDFPYDPQYGDPYNCRERYFVQRIGNDAGWLHAGRPRREAGRVALRLWLRSVVTGLAVDTAGFVEKTAGVAEMHAETVMPDQTYLQQAQPSTFGHYVLTFAYPALREGARLVPGADWVNQSPGGAGCVNGSRLAPDRARTAQLLGFDGVIEHTRDAMWQTDTLVHLLADATSLVTGLSKLAEDLEIWDSQEFDFVDLAEAYTRSSVLMPQKRNPYALSIVRGAAGVLIGRLAGLLAVVKTPSARTDNLIFAYGEVPRSLDLAARATRLMGGVVATLKVRPERMWESLVSGFSQATDLAEHVMQTCNVDYRTAYHVVGTAVREAARKGLRGIDLTGEMLDEAAIKEIGRPLGLAGRQLDEVLDPRKIAFGRTSPGGAAPAIVRDMAARCRAEAERLEQQARQRQCRYGEAEKALLDQARALAAG
ncbi:MAG TPA: argininosuccinate lyase [Actinomycetota bacterium]|nr:argininosuccinate lyase [Actinomycetota bacterium]